MSASWGNREYGRPEDFEEDLKLLKRIKSKLYQIRITQGDENPDLDARIVNLINFVEMKLNELGAAESGGYAHTINANK